MSIKAKLALVAVLVLGGAASLTWLASTRIANERNTRSGPPSGPRSRAPSDRFARDERPRRTSAPPARREPKFEESE